MKRLDLVKTLEQSGCVLLRHGGRHDIYHNPKTGRSTKSLPAGLSGVWPQVKRTDHVEQQSAARERRDCFVVSYGPSLARRYASDETGRRTAVLLPIEDYSHFSRVRKLLFRLGSSVQRLVSLRGCLASAWAP